MQVSLQRACSGGGCGARLDAPLRGMREIAPARRADRPAEQGWRGRASQLLENAQADCDGAVAAGD
eukprot:7930070-Pyramimonas_sp.AAC.1